MSIPLPLRRCSVYIGCPSVRRQERAGYPALSGLAHKGGGCGKFHCNRMGLSSLSGNVSRAAGENDLRKKTGAGLFTPGV